MGSLTFMIGIPRSGKSTYCTEWVRGAPNRAIVCADDIRLALHGKRFEGRAEPMVHAIKMTMIRALLNRGMNVIVDGTHTTEKSIRELLEIYPEANYVLFTTNKDECKRRAKETNQEDLYPVIDRMDLQLQNLLQKGIDKIIADIKTKLVGDITRC